MKLQIKGNNGAATPELTIARIRYSDFNTGVYRVLHKTLAICYKERRSIYICETFIGQVQPVRNTHSCE